MMCDESGTVCFLSVLSNIKTAFFLFLGYTNSHYCFNDREYDVSKGKSKHTYKYCSLKLNHEVTICKDSTC